VPHNFPDGDPVLKQFFLTVTVKDKKGRPLGSFQKDVRDPLRATPGSTPGRHPGQGRYDQAIPFELALSEEGEGLQIEAVLTYSLIPKPAPALLDGYLKTLQSNAERERIKKLIAD